MENLLITLGFKHLTGPMWKHEVIGIISVTDDDSELDIAKKIYQAGYTECQLSIKATLGIKE